VASLRTELRSRAILGPAGRFECAMIRPSPPATRMLLRAEQWNVQPDCAVSLGRNRCPCFFSMRRAALVWHTGVGHLLGVDLPDNLGFVSDSLCERPSQRKQRCAEPVRHGPEDSPAQPCNVLRQHGAHAVSPCTRLRTLQSPVCSITGGPQLRGESKFLSICWKEGLSRPPHVTRPPALPSHVVQYLPTFSVSPILPDACSQSQHC
jgi:hypothetical protein